MSKGFCMITTKPGQSVTVRDAIRGLGDPPVLLVESLTGDGVDVIAEIEEPTAAQITNFVTTSIQPIVGVTHTETCLVGP